MTCMLLRDNRQRPSHGDQLSYLLTKRIGFARWLGWILSVSFSMPNFVQMSTGRRGTQASLPVPCGRRNRLEAYFPLRSLAVVCLLAVLAPSAVPADELIHSVSVHPLGPNDKKPQLLGDRFEYWADDGNGQFYVQLDAPTNAPPRTLKIALKNEGGKVIAEATQPNVTENKAHFLIRTESLKAGKYEVTASLVDATGGAVGSAQSFKFSRTDKRNPVVSIPGDGIPIQLEAQSILPDATWPVRAGVPLPINAVPDASRLA